MRELADVILEVRATVLWRLARRVSSSVELAEISELARSLTDKQVLQEVHRRHRVVPWYSGLFQRLGLSDWGAHPGAGPGEEKG